MSDVSFDQAVAAIADAPPRREITRQLDRLAVSADAKAFLRNLADLTVRIGRRVLAIGRKIVAFALALAKTLPNTLFGVILGVVVTMLIGTTPLIGGLLAPLVGPLLLAFGITMGAINDMQHEGLRASIGELQDMLRGLPAQAS